MDKYEVLGLLGEGSFGRVYKAKQTSDSRFVALKVISKRGKSSKEIIGLRKECEIQRHLNHRNIIQMLDSFETDNEIVVITEFAHKALNVILSKEGYLNEDRVQMIVWDLVSALYYLHSHRVLHRDLKPQNILLDSSNRAKLCDFGFARNMSTGTHVLTSIKGTPLYMAPELIEELPYDHNADLWSLGCIIYELLVGAPPFCTASILHLIRLIRHEQIQWPTFLSEHCISFLRGLLQKNPAQRLKWNEILEHPFVKGHILMSEDNLSMPLTKSMTASTIQAKEQQRKEHTKGASQIKHTKLSAARKVQVEQNHQEGNKNAIPAEKSADKPNTSASGNCNNKSADKVPENKDSGSTKLSKDADTPSEENVKVSVDPDNNNPLKTEYDEKFMHNLSINLNEDSHPIVNEEWMVFLQRNVEEVMTGELTSLQQPNLANIIVSPLRNSNASPKVLSLVANLLSLPFVVKGVSDSAIAQIKKVYLQVKLIPNLMYSCKLLTRQGVSSNNSTPSPQNSTSHLNPAYKILNDITDEELQAIENIILLVCHLVYLDNLFLTQICDSIVILKMFSLLHQLLLLSKRKIRIVTDLVAILTQILRKSGENSVIVEQILKSKHDNENVLCFVSILRNSNPVLRERGCYFLLYLCKKCTGTVESVWSEDLKITLEALAYDSIEKVRNAAEIAVQEMSSLEFYNT